MKISGFSLLTDENVHPEVITYLRNKGFDVLDVKEQEWYEKKDSDILAISYEQRNKRIFVSCVNTQKRKIRRG